MTVRVETIPIWWQRGKTETRFEPLRGILVGAAAGGIYLIALAALENVTLAVLLGMATLLTATKASYEVGLRRFLGEAGDVTVLVGLLIKLQCLLMLPVELVPSALIGNQAFSRYAISSLQTISRNSLIIMTILGVAPLVLIGNVAFLLLTPFLWLARNMFVGWLVRTKGGFNDHSLAALQQVIEVLFYLFVILSLHLTQKFAW
ncbi:MAG TPA: hypothetical protein VLA92_03965 [Candidatus Saccharimonadales bacterium]|nr:hypothetical protein [Candidatus Saccharimonadales bacterium]